MLKTFRVVSMLEGLSLIALLFVAMPAEYYFGYYDILWNTGMTHGILWTIFFVMSLAVSYKEKWPVTFWITAVVASVTPFGCFYLERKLKGQTVPAAS